jgi:ABC-type branched-subunit amino acid transport system ATPase component
MITVAQPILRVLDLSKHYDGVAAVNGISFLLQAGEIIGLR